MVREMEFRRILGLPPYVFTIIDGLKLEARRAGRDVIDLGFGNPDIPSPDTAVEKLSEAAHNPRNHRYSASRGIPKLRQAVAALYLRRFGVELDPETEVINTIGAKEGFSHLMWVLLQPGDAALVPSPSYPIHLWGPYFAGADARQVAIGDEVGHAAGAAYVDRVIEAWEYGWPKPRDVILVHDFAYAETAFDGWKPPSILQCRGGKEVAVELYSMTKSFSMAGWRMAFLVGRSDVVEALAKLKSYLDYGTFQPIQIAATVTLNEELDYPRQVNAIYESRRNALWDGLDRIGWQFPRPLATMFAWAPIPEAYRHLGSIEFAKLLVRECDVAVSPGVGFGPGGDGHVRFALIENEQRIGQAVRNLRKGLPRLPGTD